MALIRKRDKIAILQSMLDIAKGYDTSQNSFIHQSSACGAIELEQANKDIRIVSEKFDFTKLFGEELDEGVFQRTGLIRLPATHAEGDVIISGEPETVIPAGTELKRDDLVYKTVSQVKIGDTSQALVRIKAGDTGYQYNLSDSTQLEIADFGRKVTDVSSKGGIYGGADRESDWDLKKRCAIRMREPAKAGNLYHYEEWVGACRGVYACKAYRRWQGQQTVRVAVAMDEGRPPTEHELEGVRRELEEAQVLPVGHDLILDPVKTFGLDFKLDIELDKGYELEAVEFNVKENLTQYFISKLFDEDKTVVDEEAGGRKNWTVLSYAEMGTIIFNTAGIEDYENLLINNGTRNIEISSDELASINTFTASEVI